MGVASRERGLQARASVRCDKRRILRCECWQRERREGVISVCGEDRGLWLAREFESAHRGLWVGIGFASQSRTARRGAGGQCTQGGVVEV